MRIELYVFIFDYWCPN